MCGIAGIFSPKMLGSEQTAFKELLILNQFRGMDSTGVIAVDMDGVATYDKEIYDATYFLTTTGKDPKVRETLMDYVDKVAYIGHCRSATVGTVKKENAHPFEFSKIIGVHNGTMAMGDMPDEAEKAHDTDSAALLQHINDVGPAKALAETDWSSAYSLVWYNKEERTINFLRNDKRPLFFAMNSGHNALFWTSERRAFEFINHPESRGLLVLDSKFWAYKPDTWVRVDVTKNLYSKGSIIAEPIATVKTSKSVVSFVGESGVGHEFSYPYNDDLDWADSQAEPASTSTSTSTAATGRVLDAILPTSNGTTKVGKGHNSNGRMRMGHQGKMVPNHLFEKTILDGCCLCGQIADVDDPDVEYKVSWCDEERFICEDCSKKPFVKDFMISSFNVKDKTYEGTATH